MNKIEFDPNDEDGLELARAIVINRLRSDSNWNQFEITGQGYERYVKYIGDTHEGMKKLAILTNEVLWEFTFQRIISPGTHGSNLYLPFFHITDYGKKLSKKKSFSLMTPLVI